MHCLLILPLICSYMRDLTSRTHIWCISDFVLKIGYYNHGEVQPEEEPTGRLLLQSSLALHLATI